MLETFRPVPVVEVPLMVNEPLVVVIEPALPAPSDTPAPEVELPLIETPAPFVVKATMATPA